MMAEPVLVIHGVANRDKAQFEGLVSNLQGRIGNRWELIPVFWGDLGASKVGIQDTIPSLGLQVRGESASVDPEITALLVAYSTPTSLTRATGSADLIAETALDEAGGKSRVRGSNDEEVAQAVHDEINDTAYLKYVESETVLRSVGQAIGAALQRDQDVYPSRETRGGVIDVGGLVKGVLKDADRIVGAVLGEAFGSFNQYLRATLVPNVAEALGDVFVYEHRRAEIQDRIWEAMRANPGARERGSSEKPISVVAHSLGGVISFHAATSAASSSNPRLWIDGFVTFGSQSPFFHVLDPTGSALQPYSPQKPVELNSIRRWTNLWEPLDPLAFVASRVFSLSSNKPPTDIATRHLASTGLWTHSSYWSSDDLVEAIQRTL